MSNEFKPTVNWTPHRLHWEALVAEIKFETPPKLIKQLKDLDAKYQKANGRLEKLGYSRAKQLFQDQEEFGRAKVLAGEDVDLAHGTFASRRQLMEQVRAESRAVKAGLIEVVKDAIKLVTPTYEALVAEIPKLVAKKEKPLVAECKRLGLPYERPLHLRCLEEDVKYLFRLMPNAGISRFPAPCRMLPWLELTPANPEEK